VFWWDASDGTLQWAAWIGVVLAATVLLGVLTSLTLPGGGKLGAYEPRHASPLDEAGT
jgi:hypothetical protein